MAGAPEITRVWAMPNKHTFLIKPIAELLKEEMVGIFWADPFCGENSPAMFKNDLNPSIKQAQFHLDAPEFMKLFPDNSVDGVVLDPPYSPRQVKECYDSIGLKPSMWDTNRKHLSDSKKEAARIIRQGGKAICFGWNTVGIGKKYGFYLTRILLVCHGHAHNDTIITVEVKND